ncbi:hydrogen gas-evolving membrane-bound hydrogenase subunit E [Halorarius halobius]|uniref:hydrogen gas-evolving membrane-bound hydrogenase subunit E n=1 Tax=Halorarius halobius TaxID=2962671 RepID=UPI0020CC8BAA|nr:hydrogen gas-evolving membrane-bound hydrogenase subunit E [Halorarius halobius]
MQPSPAALVAALALPFLGAAVTPLVYRLLGERTAYYAAAVAAASFALVAGQYGVALHADPASSGVAFEWIPALGVSLSFYLDGLALLISFLASGVGVLVFVYSGGYMHGEPGQKKYYATLLAFMGSMLGVALAADLVALFVFWELTSITSFLLIGHYQRTDSGRYAARKSMLITVSGGLFMLVGFLVLAFVSGQSPELARTFTLVGSPDSLIANAETVRAALESRGLLVPVIALVTIGAMAKSAQVPLHIWLPNAMEAPTPVSAFLHSATMVKAGVYLVGRFRPLLLAEAATPDWMLVVATLGLVSMTITAMLAVGATDIKELLAYSTASHLGLIIAGYGLATVYGAETGAFHILNHAVFKATLFMVAGIVAHEAGTRYIPDIAGLRKEMPITAAITAVAALGMAGVPPFNGFYSKELLFEATYEIAHQLGGLFWLYPAIAVFGSVFTFLYSIRFLMLFFGEKPDDLHAHRPPWPMLAPPLLLAGIAAVIGLGGVTGTLGFHLTPLEEFVAAVTASSAGPEFHGFSYKFPTSLSPYVLMSVVTIVVGAAAYPFYDRLHRGIRRARAVPVTSPNWYYNTAVTGANSLSVRTARVVHSGVLRRYAYPVLASVCALALGGYLAAGATLPGFTGFTASMPVALVLLTAVLGAVAVAVAGSHIAGVLTLSILGFMVAVFYVLAAAPDLALTQLVIETLVLVIFLLVLDRLPSWYGELKRRQVAADVVLSATVGVTVFVTVLLSTAASPDDGIAQFFIETAPVPEEHGRWILDAGGGGNIVNVILVDFRAFDTLGEITVVAMAALSVLTLIGMRQRGERGPGDDGGERA